MVPVPAVHMAAAPVPASEPRLLACATGVRALTSQGCRAGSTQGSPDSVGRRPSRLLSK